MSEERPREPEEGSDAGAGREPKKGSGDRTRTTFTPQQRLLILDAWLRSGLRAREFATIVEVSRHTLYVWKRQFDREGPAGLADSPRKHREGSRLNEATQRAILLMKQSHPDWGVDRIHAMLLRSEGYAASPGAIQRVLLSGGYELEATGPHRHPAPRSSRRFERARANQLWQTDLFTFTLKREGRRLYLVAFMDDYSRFVVSHSVQATATGALVREALEAGIANFGPPEEVLTDNGPQYHSWRGKSAFTKLLDRRGIRHVVSRPRHPQTLGKVERFWGTLWRECLETAVMRTIEEARTRVGHFVDYYNFQRTHQGIDNLVPADRFFAAESEVRKTLEERVARNAVELARHGEPRKSFYLTGRVGEQSISLHGEGSKVVLTDGGGVREEVELSRAGKREQPQAEEDR